MKHPEPDEWMAFVYDEITREQRADLDTHLAVCPDCVRRLGRWRETMGLLEIAAVPPRKVRAWRWSPPWRWVAAAAATLVVGIALGRLGTVARAQLDERLENLRAQVRQDILAQREVDLGGFANAAIQVARRENREWLDEFVRQYQVGRAEDRQALMAALREIDERHENEAARLGEGLASLASSTGTGFEQTQTQMRLLATNLGGESSNRNPTTEQKP